MSVLDLFEIGRRCEIGQHTFTDEAIIAYARKFDPQPFHIDAEAAKRSMFGGLCASGWHTTAVWMKLNAQYHRAQKARLQAAGRPVPQFGPSTGLSRLRWRKPTYAGDTIRFFNTVTAVRPHPPDPDWRLAELHTDGMNQHGDRVIEFDHAVLVR